MNKKVGIIIGGILLILAIIAAVFLLKGNKDTNNNVDNSKPNMTTNEIMSAFYLN